MSEQVCKCGHMRSLHTPTIEAFEGCEVVGCECEHYEPAAPEAGNDQEVPMQKYVFAGNPYPSHYTTSEMKYPCQPEPQPMSADPQPPELPPLPKPIRNSKHWDEGIEWAIAGERVARLEREDQLRASLSENARLEKELAGLRESREELVKLLERAVAQHQIRCDIAERMGIQAPTAESWVEPARAARANAAKADCCAPKDHQE